MRTTIIAAALVLSVGALAQADDPPTPKERLHNQQERIDQGVDSGELTRKEARRLREQHREIQAERREAHEDGVVTKGERQEMKRDLNKENHRIHNQKHDAQDRD